MVFNSRKATCFVTYLSIADDHRLPRFPFSKYLFSPFWLHWNLGVFQMAITRARAFTRALLGYLQKTIKQICILNSCTVLSKGAVMKRNGTRKLSITFVWISEWHLSPFQDAHDDIFEWKQRYYILRVNDQSHDIKNDRFPRSAQSRLPINQPPVYGKNPNKLPSLDGHELAVEFVGLSSPLHSTGSTSFYWCFVILHHHIREWR